LIDKPITDNSAPNIINFLYIEKMSKAWYEKNKERLLEEKRRRYREDGEFRERKKTRALDNYHSKKENKLDKFFFQSPQVQLPAILE